MGLVASFVYLVMYSVYGADFFEDTKNKFQEKMKKLHCCIPNFTKSYCI